MNIVGQNAFLEFYHQHFVFFSKNITVNRRGVTTQKWRFGTYLGFEITVWYVFGAEGGKTEHAAFFLWFTEQTMPYFYTNHLPEQW